MTIDRPYQKGMLLPDALERIKSFVGTRYDAKVVDALIRGCEAGEIGKGIVRFLNENKDNTGLVNNRTATPQNPQMSSPLEIPVEAAPVIPVETPDEQILTIS
jgi:hypothetical protein